jgi:hypothetical protein
MVSAILMFAAGWFFGIASVFIAVIWTYRKGVSGC